MVDVPQASRRVPLLPRCEPCGLYKGCRSPKMAVSGKGLRKILVVGEAPGKDEDLQGRPFVGPAGQLLSQTLGRLGVDLRQDCWITNALVCRPPGNDIKDDKAIEHCRPNLMRAIDTHKPEVVLLLGGSAVESLIGWLWGKAAGGVTRWRGRQIPCRRLDAWIAVANHPSYVLRQQDPRVARLVFERDLAAAVGLSGRPYNSPAPAISEGVEVCLDDARAARVLDKMRSLGGPVAFDYETYGLKPEGGLSIYCASFCWRGRKTVSFPWRGAAIAAAKALLESDCPKVCHNGRFEDRWSLANGIRIGGRIWDTLLVNHLIDNQKGVGDLEFLALCQLGYDPYSRHLEKFLEADGTLKRNRIDQARLEDVLLYCGADSSVTYQLAERQAALLGMEL